MPQRYKQILIASLLAIFTTYYVDITFFQHTHIMNGVTIVHSHFHGKAHTHSGTHSVNELTLISALSDFQSEQMAEAYTAPAFLILLNKLNAPLPQNNIHLTPSLHISLRAPPHSF
jgi:hypothetical protein